MDGSLPPQSLSLTTLIGALNRELDTETEDIARSLQRALGLISGAARDAAAGEQLKASPSLYERCFLPEQQSMTIRAAAALLVLVDTTEGGSQWGDINRAVRTLVEFASTSAEAVRVTLADYLSAATAGAAVNADARLACAIGRVVLHGVILRSLCDDGIRMIEIARVELGNAGASTSLRGWSGTERAVLGGPRGLDAVLRHFRDELRAGG